jgi:predicted ArsR family transcriptional regulator
VDDLDLALPQHPVREALLGLIRRDGEVTATSAAGELGGSTGLYSFHLRQLARYGVVEEARAPAGHGRVRPWRLAAAPASASATAIATARPVSDEELSDVARGLEDESYRRWFELRDSAPPRWRHDDAFSQVVYLTPEEMAGLAGVIKALIAQYQHRDTAPSARPAQAAPVAVMARLFPLLAPAI